MEPMYYLEVKYPSSEPSISKDLTGETFSTVFGTGAPPLGLFYLFICLWHLYVVCEETIYFKRFNW
jgi:hypothetical protein